MFSFTYVIPITPVKEIILCMSVPITCTDTSTAPPYTYCLSFDTSSYACAKYKY